MTEVCACHGGHYTPCDYPGGCGSPGGCCAGRACVTCQAVNGWCDDPCPKPHKRHRHGTPNPVESGYACPECVAALANLPGDIADAYPLLEGLDVPGAKAGDGRSKNPEAPLPFVVDPVDLMADWRMPQGPLRLARLAENGDLQHGLMPVRFVLGTWCRDWLERRDVGETGPADDVQAMAGWLSVRTEWAAENHPGLDEYAAELVRLRGILFGLVGQLEADERPKVLPSVWCPRCRHVSLVRRPDDFVECTWETCRRVFSADEWATVSKATAKALKKGDIDAEEVLALNPNMRRGQMGRGEAS